MAMKPNAWIPHVESFVSSSSSSSNTEIGAVAKLVSTGFVTLEALVKDMELYLTSTDHFIRNRGVTLLAEVVGHLSSKPLNSTTIHSLINFFSSRLADWQALHGALVGCLAFLRRKHNVGRVVDNDASALAYSFLKNIQVQLLALHDRKLCFEILVCLLDDYSEVMALLDEFLIGGICQAIDNEKDPSCLMLTFHIVESLVQIFPDPSGPIASATEDLFEILSCYFPIYFTHPKSDHIDIKRDDLSMALMNAFCSTPLFEPFAVTLLLEKLSADLPSSKIDSLRYLNKCILHYGANRMEKYSKSIWYSLKETIFNSSPFESSSSESGSCGDSQDNQIFKEAGLCLQTALPLQSVNDKSFITWIVEDKEFDICFSSVASEISYETLSIENRRLLNATGSILCLCAKASDQCCDRVFHSFFPRLMDILGIVPYNSSLGEASLENISSRNLCFGALYLSIEMLASGRDLVLSYKQFSPESVKWFQLVQIIYAPLSYALGSLVTKHCSKEENNITADINSAVKGLQILATFPGKLQTSVAVYEYILGIFVSIITGRLKDSNLWRMTLTSLVQIGLFIENFGCPERKAIYVSVVVEKIIPLLKGDDSNMPLAIKLEAVFSIGSANPVYMSRAILDLEVLIFENFVEAFVVGNQNFAPTFVRLLDCYTSQVLTWCNTKGNYDEVAMHFALYIWNKMESISISSINSRQEVFDSLIMTMKIVVGNLNKENQLMVMHKAYNVIQSRIISPLTKSNQFSPGNPDIVQLDLDSIILSSCDELLVSLFVAVLIALQPQVVIPDIKVILNMLSIYLLKGHISAAHALGSIFNKWPSNFDKADEISCRLEEAIDIIFTMGVFFPNTAVLRIGDNMDKNNVVHMNVIVGLAWIGKGLLMRGHEKVKEITMFLFKYMLANNCAEARPSNSDVMGNCTSPVLSRSAADAFSILMSDSDACLNKKFHAMIRPLYKQRFFSSVLTILLSSIKDSNSSDVRNSLYQAFGHVISNTPLAALLLEAKKLILPLFECLSSLCADCTNKDLLYSLLLVFSLILMEEAGKCVVIENVHIIISPLLKLTSYPHMMLVRETAIQCLVAMSEFPHARIYPMRQQVLKEMHKALDDPKRPVRQEAVRCRWTWGSIA